MLSLINDFEDLINECNLLSILLNNKFKQTDMGCAESDVKTQPTPAATNGSDPTKTNPQSK